MTEHLSRHHLERLIESEARTGPRASTPSELQADAHVSSCELCTTRKRAIEAARARFLDLRPAASFAHAAVARAANSAPPTPSDSLWRSRAKWLGLSGSVLAAAAVLLWFQRPAEIEPHETIRLKGSALLEVFVKHGEQVAPIRDGAALAVGDQLGFVYTLTAPQHLLLLGVEGNGAITRYFPAQGAASAPLPAGARVQLPVGVELDAQRGEERMIAFFASAPIDERAVRRALNAEVERARKAGRGLADIAGIASTDVPAQQASIWFRKP